MSETQSTPYVLPINPAPDPSSTSRLVPAPMHDNDSLVMADEDDDPISDVDLMTEMVGQWVRGRRGVSSITKALNRQQELPRIRTLFGSAAFQRAVFKAQRDIPAFVIAEIKRRLPEYLDNMHALATSKDDKRTQFQALKDLMDRAGTAPSSKVALSTPKEYIDAVAELLEDGPAQESP